MGGFEALLTHRCQIKRLTAVDDDGLAEYFWSTIASDVPCRIDTTSSETAWEAEAGRAPDRVGYGYFKATLDVRAADRLVVTAGPPGTFDVLTVPNAPTGFGSALHHLEVPIREIASSIASGT